MKKLFCIIAVICGILIVNISYPKYSNAWEIGAGFSPARHHYQVEYLKPWQGVSYIYITFNNKNISSKLVESLLKREIRNAIEYTSLKNDIIAAPLFHNENDGPRLPDGSMFMIYTFKTKQTLTQKEWRKTR